MKKFLISLHLFLYIIFCVNDLRVVNGQNQLECTPKSDETADRIFAKIITYGDSGVRFPESLKVLERFCRSQFDRIKTLDLFVKKCKTGLAKQMLSVFIYTIKSQAKNLCSKDSKRRRGLLKAGKCVNAAKFEFEKCNIKLVDTLQGIKLADDKRKIPLTCCEYHNYKNCFHENGKNISLCDANHLDNLLDFMDNIAANVMSILCGDYSDGSDKCDKIESPPKKNKNDKRTKSFFLPFIQVFESFAEI